MSALLSGALRNLGALDPTSDRPVFKQIADQLRETIMRRRFRENEKLPKVSREIRTEESDAFLPC